MPQAALKAEEIDRAQLDALREDLLDKLALAEQRLRQVSYAAATGKADDQDVIEARQSVEGIKQKLDGLGLGYDQVTAREKEGAAAEQQAKRRQHAVDALSLVYQLSWAIESFEESHAATARAGSDIERLENELHLQSTMLRSDQNQAAFVRAVGADAMFGTAARIRRGFSRLPKFSTSIPGMQQGALKALANEIPEALDEEVRKEALALARLAADEGTTT